MSASTAPWKSNIDGQSIRGRGPRHLSSGPRSSLCPPPSTRVCIETDETLLILFPLLVVALMPRVALCTPCSYRSFISVRSFVCDSPAAEAPTKLSVSLPSRPCFPPLRFSLIFLRNSVTRRSSIIDHRRLRPSFPCIILISACFFVYACSFPS